MKKFKFKIIAVIPIIALCLIGGRYPNSHKCIKNNNNKYSYLVYNGNTNVVNNYNQKLNGYSTEVCNNDPQYSAAFNEMKVVIKDKFNIDQHDINVLWNNSTVYTVYKRDMNSAFASEFLVVFSTNKNSKYGMCLFGTDTTYKEVKLLDYDCKSIILNVV